MSDEQAKWRPRVCSVWRRRDEDDRHRVRYRVIAHECDDVIYERVTDGAVLKHDVEYWLEAFERI